MGNPLEPLLRRSTEDETESSIFTPSSKEFTGTQRNRNDVMVKNCCKDLSYGERLLFCAICVFGGYMLSLGSIARFVRLMQGNPLPFVTIWTLGNIVSLLGTSFLIGLEAQLQSMFHPSRIHAAYIYTISTGLTLLILFICFVSNKPVGVFLGLLLVFLAAVQALSLFWHTLSYIPLVRDFLRKKLFDKRTEYPSNHGNTGLYQYVPKFRNKSQYDELA
mmetsp:Transcript_3162/g.4452  ORF Transcript_3162/g.4452 Transcript_3162/m.4452 type:complete len:219 (+) Transcript_3162:139-795(+)